MTNNYAQARTNINALYPGLAHESDEAVEQIIRECGKEASEKVKSIAIAYLLIAGVVFFLCGGYFSQTGSWSFLALGFLAFAFATLRARSVWKRELRSELVRRYAGVPATGAQGSGIAAN